MNKRFLNQTITIVVLAGSLCIAQGCAETTTAQPITQTQRQDKQDKLEDVLAKLSETAPRLKSYQCKIEYLIEQPLFDSQILRTGSMYYLRNDRDSLLRIDFDTVRQDEEPAEKYVEKYVFDGIWLTQINYELKQIKMYQLIEPNDLDPNQSIDAFDLITEHLPIVGFTKTDRLKHEFDIKLSEPVQAEPNAPIELRMKVKPDSIYADDYTSINFVVDRKLYLPVSITAFSTEEEISRFKFIEPEVNKALEPKIFRLSVPKDFPEPEVIPLKKKQP